jgi:hypothetical protein
LRLPCNSVGETALNLKTLFSLHPRIDGGEHVTLISGHRSRRGRKAGSGDLRDEPALLGNVDARSFFRQRLIEHGRTESDFVSYVAELSLADEIARIGHRSSALQLGGSRQHPFERLPVEQRLSRGK